MQIGGLQKTTLVDFPGIVAATVFTRGCSFRCSFCHNPELVIPKKFNKLTDEDDFFEFLEKRKGKLQGVCITGGEPLMQSDISQFIRRIKQMSYAVKLDTNGSYPEKLEQLIESGDIDYIAMDIKAAPDKYAQTAIPEPEFLNLKLIDDIKRSIKLVMNSGIDYEFRTTVCHPIHDAEDFYLIGELIKGAKRYFIQNFVHSKHNDETIKFKPFTEKELNSIKNIIKKYIQDVAVR